MTNVLNQVRAIERQLENPNTRGQIRYVLNALRSVLLGYEKDAIWHLEELITQMNQEKEKKTKQ